MDANAEQIVSSESWLTLDRTLLALLVKRNLRISELLLYNRLVEWAKNDCERYAPHSTGNFISLVPLIRVCFRASVEVTAENIRAHLGELFLAIRFPLMSQLEFVRGPALEGYLSDKVCKTKVQRGIREALL